MEYRSAFGVPIFTGVLRSAGLGEAVVELLRAERERDLNNGRSYRTGYSNTGWRSGSWRSNNAPHPIATFRQCAIDILLSALKTTFNKLQDTYRYERITGKFHGAVWGVINKAGDVNFGHIHTSMQRDTWALVYYPSVPPEMQGGELRLVNPCMAYRCSLGTTLSQIGADTMNMVFKPVSNDYILFPGWLEHDVRPFISAGERYALAINLSVEALQAVRATQGGGYETIHIA